MIDNILFAVAIVFALYTLWLLRRLVKAVWTIALHLRAIHHLSEIYDLAWNINRAAAQETDLSAEVSRHIRGWSAGIMNHVENRPHQQVKS